MHGFIYGLLSVPLVFISVFVPVSYCLDDCSLEYDLKSGGLIPPAPVFFLNSALAIWGLLCFHMNCENFCSSSVKKCHW